MSRKHPIINTMMAQQAIEQHQAQSVVAAIDARMSEIYLACYQNMNGLAQLLDNEIVIKPELLQKDIAHLQANKDFIAERFKLIHGHFHYKKYGDIFPNAKYITCLREPLKRTVSQYHHIIQEADPNHWLYERLSTGKMDFVEFTSLPNICRAQSWHLDGIAIEDMAHVSLSENLVDSIYQFQVLFNFERNDPYMAFKGAESIPNTNPSNARHIAKTEIPYSHLEQAKKIANFFFNHPNLPADKIPYWDFNAPNIPNEERN